MYVQTGKTFIATVIAVILSLGGIAVLSRESRDDTQASAARTQNLQPVSETSAATVDNSATAAASAQTNDENQTGYEQGYKTGYRDGNQDCRANETSATASNGYYSERTRVT